MEQQQQQEQFTLKEPEPEDGKGGGQLLTINTQPAELSADFEAARERLRAEIAQYDVVVTAETVKDAKALATMLNKRRAEIDNMRKAAVARVSEPIKAFDENMKELTGICEDGRKRILDQCQRFDEKRLELAGELLEALRTRLWNEHEVRTEFYRAEFDDLVKLGSLTEKGRLTKSAQDSLTMRVRDDRSIQDQTDRRLLELENRSHRAGLAAPLSRDHVRPFLFADAETYDRELSRIIDAEIERQKLAEIRARERLEREQAAERRAAEQAEPPARPGPEPEKASEPEPEPEPRPAGMGQDAARDEGPIPRTVDEAEAMDRAEGAGTPPAMAGERPTEGRKAWRVTCTFDIQVAPHVGRADIEAEARRIMEKAGVTTLSHVQAEPGQ